MCFRKNDKKGFFTNFEFLLIFSSRLQLKIEDFERLKDFYIFIFSEISNCKIDIKRPESRNVEKHVKYSVRIKYNICWMEVGFQRFGSNSDTRFFEYVSPGVISCIKEEAIVSGERDR